MPLPHDCHVSSIDNEGLLIKTSRMRARDEARWRQTIQVGELWPLRFVKHRTASQWEVVLPSRGEEGGGGLQLRGASPCLCVPDCTTFADELGLRLLLRSSALTWLTACRTGVPWLTPSDQGLARKDPSNLATLWHANKRGST